MERLRNNLTNAHFGTIAKYYKNDNLAVALDKWSCIQLRPISSRAFHLEHFKPQFTFLLAAGSFPHKSPLSYHLYIKQYPIRINMKFFATSVLVITAVWTVQAVPTAIPSIGGRARGVSTGINHQFFTLRLTGHIQLPYNAVRSIQSQRRRQETTAAIDTAVPIVTSVLDISTSDQVLPPTSVEIATSEPTAITSDAGIPTSEPIPPTTADVITSEPTAITSVPDIPTSEPLSPTTTDVITSEPVTLLQTFRVKVRQGTVTDVPTQVATPIETSPVVDSPTANPETPIETFPVGDSPTANPETPIETSPVVDSPTANPETPIETFPVVDSPTADPATPIETFVARSPYTNTATPPTTTA